MARRDANEPDLRTATIAVRRPDTETDAKLELNVLGMREDGAWGTLALEMSLWGFGPTFDDACVDLLGAVKTQARFVLDRGGDDDELFFMAETPYILKFIETYLAESKSAWAVYASRVRSRLHRGVKHVVPRSQAAPNRPVLRMQMPTLASHSTAEGGRRRSVAHS